MFDANLNKRHRLSITGGTSEEYLAHGKLGSFRPFYGCFCMFMYIIVLLKYFIVKIIFFKFIDLFFGACTVDVVLNK